MPSVWLSDVQAGLFSAVTTAFIIESYKLLLPDSSPLLARRALAGDPAQPSVELARLLNCLWVASLMLSLSAALIAVLGKDWIASYVARPLCNDRQWAELRTFRLAGVKKWRMGDVIAAASVLLHLSLFLFGAGLVVFLWPIDRPTALVGLVLLSIAVLVYFGTALSSLFWESSPYRSRLTPAARSVATHLLWAVKLLYPQRAVHLMLQLSRWLLVRSHTQGPQFRISGQIVGTVTPCSESSLPLSRRATSSRLGAVSPELAVEVGEYPERWLHVYNVMSPEATGAALSMLGSDLSVADSFFTCAAALGDFDLGQRVAWAISPRFQVRLLDYLETADRGSLSSSAVGSLMRAAAHLDPSGWPVFRYAEHLFRLAGAPDPVPWSEDLVVALSRTDGIRSPDGRDLLLRGHHLRPHRNTLEQLFQRGWSSRCGPLLPLRDAVLTIPTWAPLFEAGPGYIENVLRLCMPEEMESEWDEYAFGNVSYSRIPWHF